MLIPEQSAQLAQLIDRHGLREVKDAILNGAFSRLDLVPIVPEDYSCLCNSRFGGDPDLPEMCSWANEIQDLVFVFQANLSELTWGSSLGFPDSGILYVFSDRDADSGVTVFLPEISGRFKRYKMPEPQPNYIFSEMQCWSLKGQMGIDFPQYGSDEFDEIEDADLEDEYEEMTSVLPGSAESFCQLGGRFADLNTDMREIAAEALGGNTADWRSLWKIRSSFKSGLVIGDFHVLHGMIRQRDLLARDFSRVFSMVDVV